MAPREQQPLKPTLKTITPPFKVPPIVYPAVRIPQPDGSILVKVGKPFIASEEISLREAAKMLGLSTRYLEYQCSIGLWPSAHKPGGRPRSRWMISREEVIARKFNSSLES